MVLEEVPEQELAQDLLEPISIPAQVLEEMEELPTRTDLEEEAVIFSVSNPSD
jgi:hypothetical protein